jgi:hypothetical protein
MHRRSRQSKERRLSTPGVVLLGLLILELGKVASVGAQAPVQVMVDAPANGSTVGPEFTLYGWASSAAGASGVDVVAVYADTDGERLGRFLGLATYGLPRPDVVAALGDPGLLNTLGYELRIALGPGEHRLAVYAHAAGAPASEGWSTPAETLLTVTETSASAASASPPESRAQVVSPRAAAAPGVTGGTVCTTRGPSGACLAYTAANGGVGMVCTEQSTEGECAAWGQSYTVTSACTRYGEGGQCLAFGTSPAVNPPPGGVAQATALCLGYNATGQCSRYSGQPVPDPTTIRLTAQQAGSAISLSWSALPGAATYELLRCPTAQLGNCSTVAQAGTTSFTLSTRQNYWYLVLARGADGQVLVSSNFLGPL